jgi:hypothetical protein
MSTSTSKVDPIAAARCLSCAIIILVGTCSLSAADDSYLGSAGGNLFQERSTSIQMLRERVYITLGKDTSHVACRFWFLNHSRETKSVVVGFPDFWSNPAGGSAPLRNFTCKVDGVEERDFGHTLQRTIFPPHNPASENGGVVGDTVEWDRNWFTWTVDFKPSDTTVIDNEYDGVWGGTVCERAFEYVLGTGNTWKGPILDGRITFDHSRLASTHFVLRERNGAKLTPSYFEDSTVYTFKGYIPQDDEAVNIWFHSYWDYDGRPQGVDCPGFYGNVTSAEQARLMRNEIYARHGYVFKDLALAKRFQRASWYRADPTFRPEALPRMEAMYVANLLKLERQLSAGGSANTSP